MGLFGKKNDAGNGDDSNRSALFGGRSKAKSPAPSANPYAQPPAQSGNPYAQSSPAPGNPYAQPQAGNPYAQAPPDPYLAAKQKAYDAPAPYLADSNQSQGGGYGGNNRFGGDSKSPAYTSTVAGGGYGANKYSNQGGYGSDRYGTAGGNQGQAEGSRYGAGGYGGFGGHSVASKQDDDNRNALFGGAQERVQQKQPQAPGGYGEGPPPYGDNVDQSGGYGGQAAGYGGAGGYGGGYDPGPKYEDRQLTAEEEEDEEIKATKQQIRAIKQGDVASTRNALRIAQAAE